VALFHPKNSGLLEVGPIPGWKGHIIAVPSCPLGCTPRWEYTRGPITDPYVFEQILADCDCTSQMPDDPRNPALCHIAFRIVAQPDSQFATKVLTMVCVDRNGLPCPETEPVYFRTLTGTFVYGCVPKVS
jgi:hypothetical protein